MPRADLSNDLVHWIKGSTDAEAFEILRTIVAERRLLGGTGHIRGGYRCVCFTEAPQTTFHQILGRYRPFGIQVPKHWVSSVGGRHVIYQPVAEFDNLPEGIRWRHVTYDLHAVPPVDFSWEREWRVQTNELVLPPNVATVIVSHESFAAALVDEHRNGEEQRIEFEAVAYGDEWLHQSPEPFTFGMSIIRL